MNNKNSLKSPLRSENIANNILKVKYISDHHPVPIVVYNGKSFTNVHYKIIMFPDINLLI